jgi:redox-sensing transcriptional repressor
VLVGVGNLGKAFLFYENFQNYGLKILAAFDSNPALAGTECNGIHIVNSSKISNLCKRLNATVGIITVSAHHAQEVCDQLIDGGIKAIWNFAPVNLKAPEDVIVKNEDMAASLVMITRQLAEKN